MHRVWAARRAWRVRLWLAIGLALLLFPLAWLVHPAWVLGSLLGLLYPSRWEERRALADLDRQYGLAYRSALEAPPNHPWRNQLQLEAAASLRGARLPVFPWAFAALYVLLLGLVWVLPPLRLPSSSPAVASSPPPISQTTRSTDPAQPSPRQAEPPPPQGNPSESQPPGLEPGAAPTPAEETQPTQPDAPIQEAQGRDAQGQNQPQDAVGQDATRPGQTGENLQGREQPSSSPNGQDPAQPGQNSPNPTGQPQTDQPGQAQPPQPGQAQPPQPGQAQPAQPGNSSRPGQAQPSQPGQAQPPQPGQAQPGQQPGQGQPSRDNPGQGQARGGEGGSPQGQTPQARPPQNLPLRTERPAGEAPLSRGENRQGRPAPLPSPWASGQPPQNVQRQAEKYLESEPLPPEVRDVLRRYFELPPP
uniref:Uncharacterized protein n=1 Tax=Meiothermus ruber TaxID=277 RepID=A0A7C3DMG2_MEIRU